MAGFLRKGHQLGGGTASQKSVAVHPLQPRPNLSAVDYTGVNRCAIAAHKSRPLRMKRFPGKLRWRVEAPSDVWFGNEPNSSVSPDSPPSYSGYFEKSRTIGDNLAANGFPIGLCLWLERNMKRIGAGQSCLG